MQGRILGYDEMERRWQVAGADGNRYHLDQAEWRPMSPPQTGQSVDFQPDNGAALSVFATELGQTGVTAPVSDKSRIAAALLALFFGGLGIHKFYLGKNTAGIIMLLTSLFGTIILFLPTIVIGIIALIECVIYLTTSDQNFEQEYVVGNKAWF